MAQLPSINRRVLWSEHEEDILRTEVRKREDGVRLLN